MHRKIGCIIFYLKFTRFPRTFILLRIITMKKSNDFVGLSAVRIHKCNVTGYFYSIAINNKS